MVWRWSRIVRHRRDGVPHTGVASNLFDRFATAVLVVEFYLTDDLPRVMEPPVAVDP